MSKWTLSNEKYEFIKGEIIHIFEYYKIKCKPVSGFEIATKMGIMLYPYSSLSKERLKVAMEVSPDGFYLEINGREYIYYNNNIGRSYERQNMTILHEIGHCVLDHTGIKHTDEEEAEARFFAKYAIAPPVLVDTIKPEYPEELCENFEISIEAAYYAFDYYIVWKRRHKRLGCYTDYEKKLIELYKKSA